jgi:hypothetical protein
VWVMFFVRTADNRRVAARRFFEEALRSMKRAGVGAKVESRHGDVVFAVCVHDIPIHTLHVGETSSTGAVLGRYFAMSTFVSAQTRW